MGLVLFKKFYQLVLVLLKLLPCVSITLDYSLKLIVRPSKKLAGAVLQVNRRGRHAFLLQSLSLFLLPFLVSVMETALSPSL